MSNILGIIAEYNPFHNGHLYHIQNAKERANAKYVIAIITGNFTQRGNASIVNKFEKTKMALENGVDMVIELPTVYSISSAENFAAGGIKILNELGIITHISFGMEENDISLLNNVANVLYSEDKTFEKIIKEELDNGFSFPKARENAIIRYFKDERYEKVLKGSNNILAIEYLKALKKQKSNIIPVGIKREKVFYNSKKIIDEFASSTGIRSLLTANDFEEIYRVVPSETFDILMQNVNNDTFIYDLNVFSDIIIYTLRNMKKEDIKNLPDVTEGLENKIKEASNRTNNLIELINLCKSKRFTQTRIQRILVYAMLGITKKDIEISKKINPYIRVLGFNDEGRKLLSEINNKNVITSLKKFEDKNKNKRIQRMLNIDKKATDIYTIGYKKNSVSKLDYTTGVIIKK